MYAFESVDSDFVSSQVLAAGEAEISCQAVLSTAEAHNERVMQITIAPIMERSAGRNREEGDGDECTKYVQLISPR